MSCPRQALRGKADRSGGFTLVEIVIAIGIFIFALVGVVVLLGNALRSSVDTQVDSAMATALNTTSSVLRGYPTNVTSTNLYFSQQGALQANTNQAYFLFALQSVGAGGGPTNLDMWTVRVSAPLPSTNLVGNFVLTRLKP